MNGRTSDRRADFLALKTLTDLENMTKIRMYLHQISLENLLKSSPYG